MQCLESDDTGLFKFNPNTLEETRKGFGFKSREDMNTAIDVLDTWIKQQNHFLKKNFSRDVLERIIILNKGSLEMAKKRIDKYCTVRTIWPQYFEDYDFDNDFKDLKGIIFHCVLPKLTEDNHRVFLYKNIGQKFPDNFLIDYVRNFRLIADCSLHRDYCAGYIIVCDMRTTDLFALAPKLNIVVLQESVCIAFEAYGFRIKSINIISDSKFVEVVLAIFKQVLHKKLVERMHVHKNIEELYEYMPRDILPKEYGGKEISVEELHDRTQEYLKSEKERAFRKELSGARTDESLRPRDELNEIGMGLPGSFRSLNVD